jgi:hypothetical protein
MSSEQTSDHPGAILAVGLVFGIPADLLRAFVLTQLWQWFVTPYGLASPGLLHAYGLIVLFGFLKNSTNQNNKATSISRIFALVGSSVSVSLAAWGIGALTFAVMA